jgi:hypothetical protein
MIDMGGALTRPESPREESSYVLRTGQLGLVLVVPGLLQLVLGGFAPSGGMVIHSLLCPLAALLFLGARSAGGWLFAWLGVMLMTARFEPAGLLPANRLFMLLNFSSFGVATFLLVRHVVLGRDAAASGPQARVPAFLPSSQASQRQDKI